MTRFQFVVVGLIGALAIATAVLYVSSTAQNQRELESLVNVVEQDQTNTEADDALARGTYVIYWKEKVIDRMEEGNDIDDLTAKTLIAYSVETGEKFELSDDDVARFLPKQESWSSADGSVSVKAAMDFEDGARYPMVTLQIDFSGNGLGLLFGEKDRTVVLDPAELGAEIGYPWPMGVSVDGSVIFLRQVFEGEGWFSGIWRYNVATKQIARCAYCDQVGLKMPFMRQTAGGENWLIGTSFPDPEGLGDPLVGPSAIHLINLDTFEGSVLMDDNDKAFVVPSLSPSGQKFSFNYGTEYPPNLWVGSLIGGNIREVVQGYLLDWIDDEIIVVQFDNEMVLVDTSVYEGLTTIDRSIGSYRDADWQSVQFERIVKIE